MTATERTVPTAVTVDLLCRDNGFLHFTRQYQQNEEAKDAVVVRRGLPIRLLLRFNGQLPAQSIVALSLSTDSFGEERLDRSWTLNEVTSRLKDDNCPFEMTPIKSKSDSSTLCLQLSTGFAAPISKYRIGKVTLYQTGSDTVSFDVRADIILIFNPYNKEDAVFMGDEKERHEFVAMDAGMLFLRNPGTWRGPGKPWFFGQFDAPVLECVLRLLAKSELAWPDLADPVKVARALSAVINSNDEAGLLVGNWSGDYSDGRSPAEWTGSLKIFQEFHATGRPVMFGQCWVFSGCLTSAGRALGIPTRSVTNFSSAHDTNANLLIDRYYYSTGEPFPGKNSDSVWSVGES